MRYLKSILVIGLLSVGAFQSNANVFMTTAVEAVSPKTIIEIIHEGRNIQITNIYTSIVMVTVVKVGSGTIYDNTLSVYESVTLSNLARGTYIVTGTSVTTGETVTTQVIIE